MNILFRGLSIFKLGSQDFCWQAFILSMVGLRLVPFKADYKAKLSF